MTTRNNRLYLAYYGLRMYLTSIFVATFIYSCNDPEVIVEQEVVNSETESEEETDDFRVSEDIISEVFGDRLSLDDLWNYEDQGIPNYINEDNTGGNAIQDEIATLGRVLFYDKNLSSDNSIACASCHIQSAGFGDTEAVSQGVNGITGRHSMRLINARFGEEERFFWDERAEDLETQATMPIQDHIEMGFSGTQGDEGFDGLIVKLENIEYMPLLFEQAFGDTDISEERMQLALAQFVRSIQSFDSKYDVGREDANDDDDFSNFSAIENLGKALFMGRAGCDRCHQAPEFSINDNSDNNGVITVAGDPNGIDTDVTRSPTLRDIFNAEGQLNGPMMHDGSFASFEEVLAHYNDIENDPDNDNLDNRLRGRGRNGNRNGNGNGQNLNLSDQEVSAIIAFVKTLSGSNVYTDERWSDPFID